MVSVGVVQTTNHDVPRILQAYLSQSMKKLPSFLNIRANTYGLYTMGKLATFIAAKATNASSVLSHDQLPNLSVIEALCPGCIYDRLTNVCITQVSQAQVCGM